MEYYSTMVTGNMSDVAKKCNEICHDGDSPGWRLHGMTGPDRMGKFELLFERDSEHAWEALPAEREDDLDQVAGVNVPFDNPPDSWRQHAHRLAELNPIAWGADGGENCWASICRDYVYMQKDGSAMIRSVDGYALVSDGEGDIRLLLDPEMLWGS